MNSCLLTNQNYGRIVAVHGDSCVEFDISNNLGAPHALKACFFVHEFCTSMGWLHGVFARRCLGYGMSTCNHLTIFFDMIWRGLTTKADSMNTLDVSKFQISINDDGYIHATSMCQAAGKSLANYKRNRETKKFLEALSADMRIRITGLMVVKQGGNLKNSQGTWVHPLVAINLAQWCSPTFAVKVSKLVLELEGRQGRIMPPVVKIQESAPLELPHVDVALISPTQLADLDLAIALAVENSYPACQTVRDVAYYHNQICTQFKVPHYSRLSELNYAACMAMVNAHEAELAAPTQIILRAFDEINPRDLTQTQHAERGLFAACVAVLNILRDHPLRNGGE